MDKKEFKEKVEKALNQGFEAAKKSAAFLSKKAGEAARVTKLLARKMSLEQQIGKKFAEIGHRVYDLAQQDAGKKLVQNSEVDKLIEDAAKLDQDLGEVESKLEEERARLKKKN